MGKFSDIYEAEFAAPAKPAPGRFSRIYDEQLGVATAPPEPEYDIPPPPEDIEEVPYESDARPPTRAVTSPGGVSYAPNTADELFHEFTRPPAVDVASLPEGPEPELTDEERATALGAALEGLGKTLPPREGLPEFGSAPARSDEHAPLAAAIARGSGQGVAGAGGTLQMLTLDPQNPFSQAINELGAGMVKEGETLSQNNPIQSPEAMETFNPKSPAWWVERGGELIPQLTAQGGAAALTGGGSIVGQLAAWAAPAVIMEGGSAFNEAKANGATDDQAALEGVSVAAGSAFLESIGGAAVLGKVPGANTFFKKALKNAVLRRGAAVLGAAGGEAATEAAQEAWADTVAYYGGSNPDAFKDAGSRYKAAGALGAFGGAAANVAVGGHARDTETAPNEAGQGSAQPEKAPETKPNEAAETQIAPSAPSGGKFSQIYDEMKGTPKAPPDFEEGATAPTDQSLPAGSELKGEPEQIAPPPSPAPVAPPPLPAPAPAVGQPAEKPGAVRPTAVPGSKPVADAEVIGHPKPPDQAEEIPPAAPSGSDGTISPHQKAVRAARQRVLKAVSPISSPQRESTSKWLDSAERKGLDADAPRIAREVLDDGRNLNDEETAGLALRWGQIENKLDQIHSQILDPTIDEETKKSLSSAAETLEQDFDLVTEAIDRAGTEWGRAGVARQIILRKADMSLAEMESRARIKKGAPLETSERAELSRLHEENQALKKQVEEFTARRDDAAVMEVIESARKRKSRKPKKTQAEADAKIEELYVKTAEMLRIGCLTE